MRQLEKDISRLRKLRNSKIRRQGHKVFTEDEWLLLVDAVDHYLDALEDLDKKTVDRGETE